MSDTPQVLLEHRLKTLKLPTFLREYEKVARRSAHEGVDHVEFLSRLVELELIDRERRLVERRIKAAKFPTVKSLDSFEFKAIPSLNKVQVLELARCEWTERRENVIALGPSGTGKTHVAQGLGLAACQRGLSVRFVTAAALVHELMEARDERRLLRLQKQFANHKLLIIDELGSVSAAEYKYPVLGLVFLKYVSGLYEAQRSAIEHCVSEPDSPQYMPEDIRAEALATIVEDKDAYAQDNVFWIPPEARFDHLLKKPGQFYTPRSVVRVLVEILAPYEGRIYDPACGSGGMFVYSERFIEAHGGKRGQVAVYGQELSAATRKLACMNLAIRGIDYDLGKSYGDTFHNDQHPDLRADYVLANPPFNIKQWGADKLGKDARWKYGVPPDGNANYAWLQHMIARLSADGRAGIVLANGSMTTTTGGEGEIRTAMVKADLVDCMVALPAQLFANTQIPACLWFLSKNKRKGKRGDNDRRKQVLFIDGRRLGSLIPGSRKQKQLSDQEIQSIANAYHNWRGTRWGDGDYEDMPAFSQSVSLKEIETQNYALAPGPWSRVRAAQKASRWRCMISCHDRTP